MVGKVLSKLWNRRKSSDRVTCEVVVWATDPDGVGHEVVSEDISSTGVRLKFEKVGLARVLGHREEVPLEINLPDDGSFSTQGQLVWAYNTSQGGSISGWRFVDMGGNSRKRLSEFLKAQA